MPPPRGQSERLDYFGVRPACGCITAWHIGIAAEDEVAEFARRMRASGRDVIRAPLEQYKGQLGRCPHQGAE